MGCKGCRIRRRIYHRHSGCARIGRGYGRVQSHAPLQDGVELQGRQDGGVAANTQVSRRGGGERALLGGRREASGDLGASGAGVLTGGVRGASRGGEERGASRGGQRRGKERRVGGGQPEVSHVKLATRLPFRLSPRPPPLPPSRYAFAGLLSSSSSFPASDPSCTFLLSSICNVHPAATLLHGPPGLSPSSWGGLATGSTGGMAAGGGGGGAAAVDAMRHETNEQHPASGRAIKVRAADLLRTLDLDLDLNVPGSGSLFSGPGGTLHDREGKICL